MRRDPVEDPGMPHLVTIRRSITALYRRLGRAHVVATTTLDRSTISRFAQLRGTDPVPHRSVTAELAITMIEMLGLSAARMTVDYRSLRGRAAEVTELSTRFAITISTTCDPRDLPAVLGHELMHVFLDRHGLRFDGADNEILTDTAAVYLGIGWSIAARRSGLGYLTLPEYGYLLGKRHREIAAMSNVANLQADPEANVLIRAGAARAEGDWTRPPLAAAPVQERRQLAGRLDRYPQTETAPGSAAEVRLFQLVRRDTGCDGIDRDPQGRLRILFDCPRCFQRLRARTANLGKLRCPSCSDVLECSL